MKRGLLVAIVVGSLLAPATALASTEGRPVLSATAAGAQVTPGEETAVQVTLVNAGHVEHSTNPSAQARVTTARGLTARLEAGNAPIAVDSGRVGVGTLPEGATAVQFGIDVDEDAEPGTYRVPVVVHYRYTEFVGDNGYRMATSVTEELAVTLEVREEARFEVVEASTDAPVGGSGQVALRMRNTGRATADDATVQVASGSADLRLGSGQGAGAAATFVGRWASGETKTVSVDASFAPATDRRAYALEASVTYEADGRPKNAAPNRFGVVPAPEQSFDVADAASSLRAGEEGTLSGRLVNDGPGTAENAVLVLEPTGSNVGVAESEFALGDLPVGEAASFSFDVDVDVASSAREGPRQFAYHVRYETARGETVRSDPVYVRAPVEPERETFAVSAVDAEVAAGSSGELVLRLENAGERELTDLSVKLFAEDPLSSGDDEAFVDSLGPGEATNVTFGLGASGGARAKDYPVSVDVQYTEPDGDTALSDTYRLAVTVTDGGGGGLLPFAAGGAGALALAAAGVAVLGRR